MFKNVEKLEKQKEIVRITENLIKKYDIKTIGEKDIEFFIYRNGIYLKDKRLLQKEIENEYKDESTTHKVKEVINKISRKTYIPREDFDKIDPNIICVKNGVLDLLTLKLKSHSPEYNFTTQIPINYNKNKDCPKFKTFLSELLEENYIKIIQEFFGISLFREYFPKKAFIFVGETNTGKTTLIKILYAFIAKENTSALDLQKISNNKFSIITLYKKYLNIHDDMNERDVANTGNFKILTGSGTFEGEYKFGDRFKFTNYAKLIFACNMIPTVKNIGDDEAYFNRWIIIPFNKRIRQLKLYKEKEIIEDQDEMSGILNWALRGLQRVIKNSKFSYNKTSTEIKEIMLNYNNNSIVNFIKDELFEDVGHWINGNDLYEYYQQYVSKNDMPIETKEMFGRKIRKYATYMIGKTRGKRGWLNVGIKKNKNDEIVNAEEFNFNN